MTLTHRIEILFSFLFHWIGGFPIIIGLSIYLVWMMVAYVKYQHDARSSSTDNPPAAYRLNVSIIVVAVGFIASVLGIIGFILDHVLSHSR